MTDEMNKNNIGTVKVLYYRDCPHFMQTTQDVKAILSEEGLSADIQSVDLARTPDVEKGMPFAGSPTILVNGQDIAPAGDTFNGPMRGNCRLYEYKDEVYEYPPKELIREALTKRSHQMREQESFMSQPPEEIVGDGEMPAAPEHDLDYHRESEETQQPSEESTQRPREQATERQERPEDTDTIIYEIDYIETEEDEE